MNDCYLCVLFCLISTQVCSLSSGPVHKSSSTTSPFLPHAIATPPQGSEEGSPRSDKTGATGASSSTVASFSPFMGRQTKRSGLLFQEEINFCLPASESMASNLAAAAAIARTANSFANQAAKKILIGVDCCFQDIADLVKERLATDYGESNQDVLAASSFIDAVRLFFARGGGSYLSSITYRISHFIG